MSEQLLNLLKYVLVAVVYLFFMRVIRAVWAELKEAKAIEGQPAAPTKTAIGSTEAPVKRGAAKSLRASEPPEMRGRSYQILQEMTIGRAPGCNIAINDNYTSQLHARIFTQDGQAYVEDLGSTNGTYLNRRKVSAPSPLHNGDRLQIGRTVFEVRK